MSLGFENTPITQVVSTLTLLCTWFLSSSDIGRLELFKLGEGQLWRLLFSQLIFENAAESVVGLMLLYIFRQFERQMGSKKFGFFLFLSLIISLFNLVSFQILALSVDVLFVPASGPYFIIYSMLAIFYSRVPKLKNSGYQFFGLSISEKTWVYLLAGQLSISGGIRSMVPALSGYFVGYIYNLDYCSMQTFRFPRIIERIFGFFGTMIVSLIPASTPRPAAPTAIGAAVRPAVGRGGGGGGGGGVFGGDSNGMPPSPPSEEAIETLMGMGFDRAAVITALQSTNNNVESAANMLLR